MEKIKLVQKYAPNLRHRKGTNISVVLTVPVLGATKSTSLMHTYYV